MNYTASFSVRIALLFRSNEHSSLSSPSGNIPELQEQNWGDNLHSTFLKGLSIDMLCSTQQPSSAIAYPNNNTHFL